MTTEYPKPLFISGLINIIMNNKILELKDVTLMERRRVEIISLFGNNYVEDNDGNIIYLQQESI